MTLEKALTLAEEMSKETGRDCLEDEMIQVFAKSIKLVQSHANSALNKLPERWNMGFQAGLKQAIPYEKELTEALRKERKDRKEDNAGFTADIMKLEDQLRTAEQRVARECLEIMWEMDECTISREETFNKSKDAIKQKYHLED